ncbi:hypothetical protein [Streptomonospora salina]|uniref:Uncharacterized protein n=1 Tax=Streptomonospora salina TaxID=104205 RepID=A0A841E2Q9_9ACTN|nr:hypothetical protein [Streptomonospora salina]MBB5997316.1 hypothetical protein [Streptomonospora salina]
MSPKKRNKKTTGGGAQLSGNPQKRAEQLAEREARQPVYDEDDEPAPAPAIPGGMPAAPTWDWGLDAQPGTPDGLPGFGGSDHGGEIVPQPGWAESHEYAVALAHRAEVPDSPRALDDLACDLVGRAYLDGLGKADDTLAALMEAAASDRLDEEELFDRAEQSYGYGTDPVGWLDLLAERAAREITDHAEPRWQGPWMLLRGMMAWAPYTPDATSGSPLEACSMALMEAGQRLVDDGTLPRLPDPLQELRPQPTAWPLVLHDAYGTRTALLAPFAYGDDRRDPHWYCWDVDRCAGELVVGAGVFASAEDAAAEWRAAVGGSAPADAQPQRCSGREASELLELAMDTHLLAGMRSGGEPAALVAEQFRSAARAEELSVAFEDRLPLPQEEPGTGTGTGDAFRSWYADRHGGEVDADTAAALAGVWGPQDGPDSLLYACSPHRIRLVALTVSDDAPPGGAAAALELLPAWVEWCLERSGLGGAPAEAARAQARTIGEQAARDAFDPDDADVETDFRPEEM